jgi:hypothetical protein
MFELWLGFAVGLLVRWGDRMQYVVSEQAGRSFVGYLEHNWLRLAIRLLVTIYAFHLAMGQGVVVNEFIAFSIGVSSDALVESFVDRAKKAGEKYGPRLKNGGNNAP